MAALLRLLVLVLSLGLAGTAARAVDLGGGVSYEEIGRWTPERLNRILQVDMPSFAGIETSFPPARTGVKLYRVTYPSVVPERGNRPIRASGLLAIPDDGGARYPLVSYQHGTVYGRQQVPSFPEQSPETQAMLALFAAQGYALIGADYFGMGVSTEPEGYLVKASHQQATADMLTASRAVFADLKVETDKLFLTGWSQGGFVTLAFLERLETLGIKVDAAATASAPSDMALVFGGFLNFPRKIDAAWLNSIFILSVFSFESYYGIPGLAQGFLQPDIYEIAKAAYERRPFDPAAIPTDLHKLIRAEFFDPTTFAASAFGRLAAATTAYRWVVRSPVRTYYGETDEAIAIGVGQLPMTYQRAMGNRTVEAVSTGPTTHRGTFVRAAPLWKAWFDGLAK